MIAPFFCATLGAAQIHQPLSVLLAFKSRQAGNELNFVQLLASSTCNLTGQE